MSIESNRPDETFCVSIVGPKVNNATACGRAITSGAILLLADGKCQWEPEKNACL